MLQRPIPSTGELLPVIGCGTWRAFDVRPQSHHRPALLEVVRTLAAGGGTVLDSSPMYGHAEAVVGELLHEVAAPAFVATKVWTEGREAGVAQMSRSTQLLRRAPDLIQVHNLLDWRT